jgi:DNA-binding MarR family transcriptional regulator
MVEDVRMTPRPEWAHPADERILQHLVEHPPDYVPLVANRLGMHLGYVERRVDLLVERGLLEPVSGEVIYAVTDDGATYLAERASHATADD